MKSHKQIAEEQLLTIRKITLLNEDQVKSWIIDNQFYFKLKGYSVYKVLKYTIAYAKMHGTLPVRKDLETLLIVDLNGINPFLI